MKRAILLLASVTLLAVLGGCSHAPIPVATSYPATTQQRMQAAHHWQVLADHVASRIQERLPNRINNQGMTVGMPPVMGTEPAMVEDTSLLAPAPEPLPLDMGPAPTGYAKEPALYVNPPKRANETPFGNAFYQLLRGALVNKNMIVTNQPDRVRANCPGIDACTPMLVNYDIQLVHHKDRNGTINYPGRFTVGAATMWLVAHIADKWDPPAWSVMPLAVAMDINDWRKLRFPGQTNTEIVITTTITDGDLVVFSESNIYYINTGDDDHYEKQEKTFKVVAQ